MNYKSYLIEKDLNNLKNKVVLFYGENLGLKNHFRRKIKTNYQKASIEILTEDELLKQKDLFFDNFFNMSLFAEQKIYFIDQASDKILSTIQELEDKIEDQRIFVFGGILDRKSKLRNYFEKSKDFGIVACYADNEISLRKIVTEKLKDFSNLSSENINIIVTSSNCDRVNLENEITKIKTYFNDKKIINIKLLELLNLIENENFNDLRDAALNGNKIKTNQLLNNTIIEKEKIIYYLSIINQRLYKLKDILYKNSKPVEQTVEDLKPPIFWKDKPNFIFQAKKWDYKKVQDILEKTFKLELTVKSAPNLNKEILLKKMLVDICDYANV